MWLTIQNNLGRFVNNKQGGMNLKKETKVPSKEKTGHISKETLIM